MITRNICGIELDVDPNSANAIYFEKEFADKLASNEIEAIQTALYKNCGVYHPVSVLWEVTNQCNYHCPFCYIHYPNSETLPFLGQAKWSTLIDDFIAEGMLFCTLTGGECLLHPDFPKLYAYLKEHGVIVSIFTNASLLSDEHFVLFQKLPPYKVEVSLYSMAGNNCCCKKNAENAMKHVLRLKEMGIQVICKTPINCETEAECAQIQVWCKKHNIPYYSSVELLPTFEGKSLEHLRAARTLILEEEKSGFRNMAIATKRQWGYKRKFDCSAGKYSSYISFDLGLYPCISAYGISIYRQNLSAYSVHECVSRLRNQIEQEKPQVIQDCYGCNYYDVCDRCVLSCFSSAGNICHTCADISHGIAQYI